jgi:hypothetical protein
MSKLYTVTLRGEGMMVGPQDRKAGGRGRSLIRRKVPYLTPITGHIACVIVIATAFLHLRYVLIVGTQPVLQSGAILGRSCVCIRNCYTLGHYILNWGSVVSKHQLLRLGQFVAFLWHVQ